MNNKFEQDLHVQYVMGWSMHVIWIPIFFFSKLCPISKDFKRKSTIINKLKWEHTPNQMLDQTKGSVFGTLTYI